MSFKTMAAARQNEMNDSITVATTTPEPRPSLSFEVVVPHGESVFYNLGPHPPRLWPDDVELVHRLWLELSEKHFGARLHDRDIVRAALRHFETALNSPAPAGLIQRMSREVEQGSGPVTGFQPP